MGVNIKDIFNNAARSTGTFYSGFSPVDPKTGEEYGTPPKSVFEKAKDAVKGAIKTFGDRGSMDYANRVAAYNSYLNTLKYMKQAGQFSIKRGRVSTTPTTSPTGSVGRAKTSSFENALDKWNSRFRKFAVTKYYESLTRGR